MWKGWAVVFLGLGWATASFRPAHAAESPFPRPANFVTLCARYPLDEAAEAMLRRNGFVVLDSVTTTDLPRVYDRHVDADLPSFVTTDALLHLWYELHRHLLREAERRSFYPRLCEVVTALGQANATLRKQKTDDLSQSALRQAAVTLAVAERLLLESTTAPSDLRPEVEVWAEKVLAHSEAAPYPGEDFTQYEVRGHYADRPDLSRYFRGSLWLSRRFMSVEPAPEQDPDAPLRQAVALAAVVRAAPEARERLQDLQAARQFLTGRPNAISVEQVISALDRALGQGWSLPQALQPSSLAALRQELARPEYPASPVFTRPTLPHVPFPKKVVALLPDFAIPDSVLFQNTVNPAILNRSLPTGLEVAAALGSDVARQQIQSADPQADQVLATVDRHRPLVRDKGQSVYDGWLHTLSTLFVTDPRAPDFMQGDAWRCEKLNTGLSSWAQLRHAYILYGSQSYAATGDGGISLIALVEPIPAFYRALGSLAGRTRSVLSGEGRHVGTAPTGDTDRLLGAFEEKCRELEGYAEAELQGRLTPEQAQRIAEFGPWMKQFPFTSAPLVADVATGMSGEVLHAATGPFRPLLVMPDRSHGVAYIGWVMSYYEFRRPNFDRLTDAEWQVLHQNTYWRPDRPEWARKFVCGGGGEEWPSRAPLREAERLLAFHQTDDALALLRRTVAENPDTLLATEAQCRLGKFFFDQGEYEAAEGELARYRRMVGGDAWHAARRLLEQVRGRQKRPPRGAAPPEPAELKEARTALESLKDPPLTSLQRYRLEKKIAGLLLLSRFRTHPQSLGLLKEAAAACRTSYIREALNYEALMEQLSGPRILPRDPSADIEACIRFAQTAESAPLRAAALAVAVEAGLHHDDPQQALRLLRPYAKPEVFQPKNSPVLAFLQEVLVQKGEHPFADPQYVFLHTMDPLRSRLMLEAYRAGDLEATMGYWHTLPGENRGDEVGEIPRLYADFPDFARQPLRLFAQAEGPEEQGQPKAAADRFFEVYQKYPHSKLAPFALWRAQWSYREAGETRRAEEVEGLLASRFPNTYPGLLSRTRAAFARGDEALTRHLLALSRRAEERQPDYSYPYRLVPPNSLEALWGEREQHGRLKKALQPLVEAAGRPELLKEIPPHGDVARVAEKFAAALPDRAAEVYLALLPFAPALPSRFLELFPDHPEAAKIRWRVVRDTPFPACLRWLVPVLNGEPGPEQFQEASRVFAQVMGEGDLPLLRERARYVRGEFPETRAAWAADCLLARKLVQSSRPEEALKVLREVLPRLAEEDPLREEAQNLSRRAELEVWAKHQPEWTPVWSRAGQPRRGFYFDRYRSIAAPVVAHGLLFVPVSRGIPLDGPAALDEAQAAENWDGLVALDEAQGTERWAARIGPVSSLSTDAAGRLFCGTGTSALVALDAATGQVLYERVFDLNRCWPTYAVDAGGTLVVGSLAGVVAGLSPSTGETLWQKEWMPISGMPAVIGSRVFLATTDVRVRALDAASGNLLWERTYQPEEAVLPRWPLLTAQPVVIGDDRLLICAAKLELLDARDGRLLQSASQEEAPLFGPVVLPGPGDVPVFGPAVLLGRGFVVGWNRNDQAVVATLPDLKVRRLLLPRVRSQARGALQGRTLYVPGEEEVQAVDLDTGAVFAWFGDSDTAGDWITFGRWVYVISIDGRVRALPFPPAPPASSVSGATGDTPRGSQ